VERCVQQIDATLLPLLGADENTPVGITIRFSERSGKRIAENLILDAAVDCPRHLERAKDEKPPRTVAHFTAPPGDIIN
jgi:hypothetical protein